MFLYLSKIAPLLLYPLGLACILALLAAAFRRWDSWSTALAVASALLLLIFSNGWVAGKLSKSLEWRYCRKMIRRLWMRSCCSAEARAVAYPRTMTEVNEAGDRLFQTVRLYRAGKAPRVIVTGGAIQWMGSVVPEAEGMRELLEFMGVPADAIVADAAAQNTYENALHVRAIADELGVERVLLVTSALHMPRSVGIFERQGFSVIPAPTDFLATRSDEDAPGIGLGGAFFRLLPDVQYLEISTRVLKEYLGMAVYRARGWM